jgi:hypothetical protein
MSGIIPIETIFGKLTSVELFPAAKLLGGYSEELRTERTRAALPGFFPSLVVASIRGLKVS